MLALQFLGAAGTVTGSKHALLHDGSATLIDCGLYQGPKTLRLRNWEPLPIPPPEIDAVIVTHAHIDHTGYLPRLVKDGFKGRVYATPATADLLGVLLPDTGHLQEEEAAYANKKGYSRHKPALPLFTERDAYKVLGHLERVEYGETVTQKSGLRFRYQDAGHILGSGICETWADGVKVVFSGDLGREARRLQPADGLAGPLCATAQGYFRGARRAGLRDRAGGARSRGAGLGRDRPAIS